MGILSFTYNAAKAALRAKGKVSPTITKVKPKVNKTKLDKAKSELAIATQKSKAAGAKLDQTLFESKNKAFRGDDFTFSPKTGRSKKERKELKRGTGLRRKTNVEKIKKTFGSKKGLGMQSVIYGLDKNPKITAADPKAKFIAAANKKKKKKVI